MTDTGIIYFDMDGVLADFDRGVAEILHLPPIEQGKHTAWQDDELFAGMRKVGHFYRMLEPIPGSVELFGEVYQKHGDRCRILSGIPKASRGVVHAAADKREWVERFLPGGVIVNTVLRAEKPMFVKSGRDILIDDFSRNISEWEEAGGTGILFVSASGLREKLLEMGIL